MSMFHPALFGVEPSTGYRVYIAGPISGDLLGNIPPFFDAEKSLLDAGHGICNPARADGGRDAAEAIDLALEIECPWEEYMKIGLRGLLFCNAIALLPGWWNSRGADLEQRVAISLGYAHIDHLTGKILAPGTPKGDAVPEEMRV